MTTDQHDDAEGTSEQADPATVSRRNFMKVAAGAAAAGGVVAATIGIVELTRQGLAKSLVAHYHSGDIPENPTDRAWQKIAKFEVTMAQQNLVAPFGPKVSVPTIFVRSMHNGTRIAFEIEWDDAEADQIDAMARFRDAVAVQLPAAPAGVNPAVTMGAADQPVHILQWRAAWQLDVDKGRQTVHDAFPNMFKDAPPEELMGEEGARQFYPALVMNNPMARHGRTSPVDEMVAVGFGTLTTHAEQSASGKGVYRAKRWQVVLSTQMAGGADKSNTTAGTPTQVAFAVWNGSAANRGARKQWANWTPIDVEATA